MADLYRVYRIDRPDGTIEYSNQPSGAGEISPLGSKGRAAEPQDEPYKHSETKSMIAEARKRIPKMVDYLNYLEYLRNHRPLQLDRVLKELQAEDPQTWLKLQKYPLFRPLRDTQLGLKAGEKNLTAAVGLASGNFMGSAEKWFEGSVNAMMKRDRWGPYADVSLGARASTLPPPKSPTYSNSRLGQYLKVEDARLATATKEVAKELEASRSALRAAKATAFTRVAGPLVDVGVALLDPEVGRSVGNEVLRVKARRLYERGVIDEEQWAETQNLLSQGKYVEMQKLMSDAMRAQAGAGR